MPISRAESVSVRLAGLVDAWRSELGGAGSRRISQGRLSREETEEVGKALLSLQRGLTGDRRLAGASYMDRPDLLGAYLLYYWPVSYLQVSLALEDALRGRPVPARVLDLGSGPGPASAALLDMGARDFVLVDSSERALDLARRAVPAPGSPPRTDLSIVTLPVDLETGLEGLESRLGSTPGAGFDLVVMSHCLNELHGKSPDRTERRAGLLDRISRLLKPEGLILLVEPSLLSTSRELFELRDVMAARGFRVIAPCARQGPCPALAAGPGQTCHAEAAWTPPEPVSSLAAAAGLDRASVKMSYLALALPAAGGHPGSPPLAQDGTSFEAVVVSEPMLNKAGRIRYVLCGERGRFTFSARRDEASARAQGFFALARYDRIAVSGAEDRAAPGTQASFGFAAGTSLRIKAPSPRIEAFRAEAAGKGKRHE